MIKVKVKFFAPFNNLINTRMTESIIEEGATFFDLLFSLAEEYPKFRNAIPDTNDMCIFYNNMVPVMNDRILDLRQCLKEGDEIHLFGSISGG